MDATAPITLDEATRRYPSVSRRTLRKLIAKGRLPASKPGRALLILPEDLARVLAPVVRTAPTTPGRESPNARADRQLREAGINL